MTPGFRRPTNPVMRTIDDAINMHEARGMPMDVDSIVTSTDNRIRYKTVLKFVPMLLRPHVRARLVSRGYLVADADDYDRKLRDEMLAAEFDQQVLVKQLNFDAIAQHLKADKAVQRFLHAKEETLGRPVTIGEFSDDVERIYERYGI